MVDLFLKINLLYLLVCPFHLTFEENGIFMFGAVFLLFSHFSVIEIILFGQKFLYPIDDIDSLKLKIVCKGV